MNGDECVIQSSWSHMPGQVSTLTFFFPFCVCVCVGVIYTRVCPFCMCRVCLSVHMHVYVCILDSDDGNLPPYWGRVCQSNWQSRWCTCSGISVSGVRAVMHLCEFLRLSPCAASSLTLELSPPCLLCFLRQVFLYPRLASNSVCSIGWLLILLLPISQELGLLQLYVTSPGFFILFMFPLNEIVYYWMVSQNFL